MIAEHLWETHWVQNILAEPRVGVRVERARFPARGRVVDPESEPDLVDLVRSESEKKYGWGDGLIVELRPEPSSHTTTGGNR